MSHYCTYFDRGYLPTGLALWESLRRHEPGAALWVLALDADTAAILQDCRDPDLRVLGLPELLAADPGLAAVQAARSRSEFIFTLTPCLSRHLLRTRPEVNPLVYLDADLYFFSSPSPIMQEMGDRSIFVVPHRYPPWHDDSAWYGCYNVGVLAFRGDAAGLACLDWWRDRCLESCALVADGAHYGDQKYLDEWPRLFPGVVESKHPGVNMAPWNWARHRFHLESSSVMVDGRPLVVYHFAQFRPMGARWCDSGQLEYGIMPLRLRSRLYGEYWRALERAEAVVRRIRPDFSPPRRGWRATLGPWRLALLRLFWGQCWWRIGPWLVAGRLGIGRYSGYAMALYRKGRRRPS